ncbi:SWIM zinc finger family protein [Cellulomonas wangsupingiae]|uniref:SWIM zinc finger family protein n=1 Tax=Cellulomonas wangsupingiae TaxID=2968085 RepID=UPI001D0E2B04|nr:SWIM zinc finger family protein [Cellulomonas wangsupingiae]MCM0639395.1 SWIM zinc finger family protein [Cellulomonas wangsupingiae]
MSVRTDVAALLARYDEDTWVALANRGLLRRARKDREQVAVRVAAEDDASVTVAVGDVLVRLGPAGPAGATCTCPSPVICRHVLTAGLWLAGEAAGEGDADEAPPGQASPEQPSQDRAPQEQAQALHTELMTLDAAALTAYAGLAGYRWAHRLLDDADSPPVLTRDRYLTITFPRRGLTARYLGGGLDALVLDQTVPDVARFRVAAVLAWQRAHGLVLAAPPAPRSRSAEPSATSVSRTASRERLRATAAAVLRDTVRVGVSHLSPALHDRLVTSAVWAQGVEYHRLALLLRRIADEVELLLVRSARADDLALLDDVAVAHALVAALDATAGREPAGLLGRARTSYDAVRRLDLVGLGGRPWRTGSGYHGLTCVFWDTTASRMLTWTDARPEGVPGFDPRARWWQPAPWTGLGAPAQAAGRAVVLTQAQASPDGRLSGVESTSASLDDLTGTALLDALPVREVWADLAAHRSTGLLDVVDQASLWTVVRPAAALPAQWDPVEQTLRWPLLDGRGDVLVVEVPWSRLHAHAIARIESLGAGLPAGACVVARVQRVRGRIVGEPLSLVLPDGTLDALHFDPDPEPSAGSALVAGLLAAGTADRPTSPETAADAPGAVPAPVAAVRAVVEQAAQRGCGGTVPGDVHRRLAAAHAAARAVGLAVFVEPDPALDPAESLLRSSYLVQLVERAVG